MADHDATSLQIDLIRKDGAGGQHVGFGLWDMRVTDPVTGIVVIIPSHVSRSQHKQRLLAASMIEWAHAELGWPVKPKEAENDA